MKLEDRLRPIKGEPKERWTGPFFDVVVTKLGSTELYAGRFYTNTGSWAQGNWHLQHAVGPASREAVLRELEEEIGRYSPVLKQELRVDPKSALTRVSEDDDPV